MPSRSLDPNITDLKEFQRKNFQKEIHFEETLTQYLISQRINLIAVDGNI